MAKQKNDAEPTDRAKLTPGMVRTVFAMCENNLRVKYAAKELNVRPETIHAQLRHIYERTALNCKSFWDAIELYNMIWDEYPELVEKVSSSYIVGKRVPMLYQPKRGENDGNKTYENLRGDHLYGCGRLRGQAR